MKKDKLKDSKLDIQDVINWIMEHFDDQSVMDVISNLVFPKTTKYKNMYPDRSLTRVYHQDPESDNI